MGKLRVLWGPAEREAVRQALLRRPGVLGFEEPFVIEVEDTQVLVHPGPRDGTRLSRDFLAVPCAALEISYQEHLAAIS